MPYIVRHPGGPGRLRKIAIIGGGNSIAHAPFSDPTWEIWAHSSSRFGCPRCDRYFDLHGRDIVAVRESWDKSHEAWLKSSQVPVMMQEHYPDIPASVPYPKERIMAEFPWRYFTSQTAWMVALALTEGVTHLGFYGIHYQIAGSERFLQRPGCEFWLGVAAGRGVQLVIPESAPLLKEPSLLYGYESHDANGLRSAYQVQKVDANGPDRHLGPDQRADGDVPLPAAGSSASGEAGVLCEH